MSVRFFQTLHSIDEVLPFKNFLNNNPGISNMTLDFESGVELGIVL